jgi:hypothetical protein
MMRRIFNGLAQVCQQTPEDRSPLPNALWQTLQALAPAKRMELIAVCLQSLAMDAIARDKGSSPILRQASHMHAC